MYLMSSNTVKAGVLRGSFALQWVRTAQEAKSYASSMALQVALVISTITDDDLHLQGDSSAVVVHWAGRVTLYDPTMFKNLFWPMMAWISMARIVVQAITTLSAST